MYEHNSSLTKKSVDISFYIDVAFNLRYHGRYKREEIHTRALFGIVLVFLIGHSLRFIMDAQELIDINKGANSPYEIDESEYHCASKFSLLSKVSILIVTINFYDHDTQLNF